VSIWVQAVTGNILGAFPMGVMSLRHGLPTQRIKNAKEQKKRSDETFKTDLVTLIDISRPAQDLLDASKHAQYDAITQRYDLFLDSERERHWRRRINMTQLLGTHAYSPDH
jgi:hypothetical protein